jgi:hypothetical protein
MLKIKKVVVVSILVIIPLTILAQNNTNSPYTRYGYGELADRSFGAGRAMGGVGYGIRSNKQINPLNPASYTSMDSLTFIFDLGVAGQFSWFNDGLNRERHFNGNPEYVALQFPVHRRIAVSAGILPYSYVGYDFGSTKTSEDGVNYVERFIGKGGLNEAYAGLSLDVWKKRLSVGVNIGYLFGRITHNQVLTLSATTDQSSRSQTLQVNDMKLNLGVQYTQPVSTNEHLTFGFAFTPAKKVNATPSDIIVNGSAADTLPVARQVFDLPHSFGTGISYVKQNKLTLAADFLYETWSQAQAPFFDTTNELKNRIRLAGGMEFIPNYQNRAFFSRIRYRAGFHYSNSYLQINSKSYNEYGASIGLGLPVDNRSFLNLSFEYVKIKPETKVLIDEQYFRFTVNYTFNERWFFKFKVD